MQTQQQEQSMSVKYRITDHGMPHLERIRLGAKLVLPGEHKSMNFHDHEFSELSFVLQSDQTLHWLDGKSCPVRRGDVILMHPGTLHAYENTNSFSVFNVLFEPEYLPFPLLDGNQFSLFSKIMFPSMRKEPLSEKPLLTLKKEALEEIEKTALLLKEELSQNLPGKNLRSFTLFLDILTRLCRASGSFSAQQAPMGIPEAVNYINSHFRRKISVELLAKQAHMSKRVFFRSFQAVTGHPPLQYLINKRLEAAERLLSSTALSLNDIASECGFYDSNHLNRVFKQHYKISPGKFRKTHT